MKMVRVGDFLTKEEILAAIDLYKKAEPGTFAKSCEERIIKPNLTRINSSLGQENDPRYLAYTVEAAIMQGAKSA